MHRYLDKVKTLSANGGGIVGELASIGAGGFEIAALSAGEVAHLPLHYLTFFRSPRQPGPKRTYLGQAFP
jgi:hypothetical protein